MAWGSLKQSSGDEDLETLRRDREPLEVSEVGFFVQER